jgi:hypothetical protein
LFATLVSDQHSATRTVLAPSLTTTDFPGIADHQLEVIIVVNGSRDCGIIFAELGGSDLPVLLFRVEGFQELTE